MAMSTRDKVRENRMRRMADRQGMVLRKSGRRDPRAVDYGMYVLIDAATDAVVAGLSDAGRAAFTLDDAEAYLTSDDRPRGAA
jgi:hypothetical protein